jgi:hypothetical protein
MPQAALKLLLTGMWMDLLTNSLIMTPGDAAYAATSTWSTGLVMAMKRRADV